MDKSTSSFKKKNNPLDVLFVNLPTYSPDLSNLDDATSGDSLTPPLGIQSLSHSIKDCSFVSSYQCADFGADFKLPNLRDFLEKNNLPEFVNKKLKETVPNKPDVVAVSLMFSSTYDFFQIVIEEIKKCWDDAIIIVGGVHATNSADYLLKNNGKHAFNVGTGVGISVLDVITSFEKANNMKINYAIGKRRIGDIEQIYANGSLVKEKLGWEPKETLEQAMISAWKWEKLKE